jgi:hypothetical protein
LFFLLLGFESMTEENFVEEKKQLENLGTDS